MSHWTQNSHRREIRIDYQRWVVMELAKQCGVDEGTAFYCTRLVGWERKSKSSAPRPSLSDFNLNQFLSLVACTEWRDLSMEQAKEVARAAGIADDGKHRKLKRKDPRPRWKRGKGTEMPDYYLRGGLRVKESIRLG